MRIPSHHVLSLELCKQGKLRMGNFHNKATLYSISNTWYTPKSLNDDLSTIMRNAGYKGVTIESLNDDIQKVMEPMVQDYRNMPFQEFYLKYDNLTFRKILLDNVRFINRICEPEFDRVLNHSSNCHRLTNKYILLSMTCLVSWIPPSLTLLPIRHREQKARNGLIQLMGWIRLPRLYMKQVKQACPWALEQLRLVDCTMEKGKINHRAWKCLDGVQAFCFRIQVDISCRGLNCPSTFNAVVGDHVILATTAPALSLIEFSPPMPPSKMISISQSNYASAIKVLLVFTHAWFNENVNFTGLMHTDHSLRKMGFPDIEVNRRENQ